MFLFLPPPSGLRSCSLPALFALSLIPLHHHPRLSLCLLLSAILLLSLPAMTPATSCVAGESSSNLSVLIHPSTANSCQPTLVYVSRCIISYFISVYAGLSPSFAASTLLSFGSVTASSCQSTKLFLNCNFTCDSALHF